ncbi:MAG: hypothetical protein AAF622_18300, partial [Cyanobacteria bacterium P01_C01_bin.147]
PCVLSRPARKGTAGAVPGMMANHREQPIHSNLGQFDREPGIILSRDILSRDIAANMRVSNCMWQSSDNSDNPDFLKLGYTFFSFAPIALDANL